MTEETLRGLFDRVAAGDREAFGCVYRELKQPVYTICRRILHSPEAAEDITHDLFVKLFTAPPDVSVRNIRAWIFQMARNLAIDALRKQSKMTGGEGETADADQSERIHWRLDLENALGRLPRSEREILTLRLNGELNFREIARIVDLSLPAVYRKYRKALKRLQSELNGG